MCSIFSNIFLLLIFALESNRVSAVPILESNENYLEHNFVSNIELESSFEEELLFSKIDPSIAEDARLETVSF